MFLSITRLRLRSWFGLPKFFNLSQASIEQAIVDEHCLGGATYMGPGLTFWTATLWASEDSMKNYVRGGAHREALPWLAKLCSEGATSHLTTQERKLPSPG